MKNSLICLIITLGSHQSIAAKDSSYDPMKELSNEALHDRYINVEFASPNDRRVIIDRKSEKYADLNAIGIIKPDWEPRAYAATGFLVRKACAVLTNVHVAYKDNEKINKKGQKISFSVGQTGNHSEPFELSNMEGEVVALGPYVKGYGARNDWALIRLKHSVPESVATPLPFGQMPVEGSSGRQVFTAGFPGIKTWNGKNFDTTDMYGDPSCKILDRDDINEFSISCQVTHGDSGSPLLTIDSKGRLFAVGMITSNSSLGNGIDNTDNFNYANIAMSFTKPTEANPGTSGNDILNAIDNMKCDP